MMYIVLLVLWVIMLPVEIFCRIFNVKLIDDIDDDIEQPIEEINEPVKPVESVEPVKPVSKILNYELWSGEPLWPFTYLVAGIGAVICFVMWVQFLLI